MLTLHVLAPEARNLDKWHEDWAEVSPPSARPCAARLGCQSLPGGLQAQFVATALGTYCLIASTPQSLLIVHDTCLLGLYLLAPERCYLEIQPFSPKAWKMRRTTRTRTSNHRIDQHPPPPQLLEDPLLGLPACSVYLLYVCFAVLLFLMFLCMRTVQVLLPMPHVAVYASSF